MLTADQQRFMLNLYGQHAAEALAGGRYLDRLRTSSSGYFGANGHFTTTAKGVFYSWPGEPWGLGEWPHRVTWPEIERHRKAQPENLQDQLRDALDARSSEARRHWDAQHAIAPNCYAGATPEVVAQLDAEFQSHVAKDRELRAAVSAALAAILPLGTDEPTDLIEWAAALQ